MLFGAAGVACAFLAAATPPGPSAPSRGQAQPVTYEHTIKPILEQYCFDCHGNGRKRGGLDLDAFADALTARQARETWQSVLHQVRTAEMPPRNRNQPTLEQRDLIAAWIEADVFKTDCDDPDPGRVTLRRLNRVEYNNTIRDLTGIHFTPADDFPSDDVGYGFDNIGDVLSLPPVLLEKYLASAETILEAALSLNRPGKTAGEEEAAGTSAAEEEENRPETFRRIILCEPAEEADKLDCARRVIEGFATRAFRRPVSEEEVAGLAGLFQMADADGASFVEAIQVALQAVLISPHFLFRGEHQPAPDDPRAVHPIGEFALASRLSYFLWSTMPDEALFAEAKGGTLRRNLDLHIKRMLQEPKATALVDNFVFQWLQVRSLETAAPDREHFPAFDDDLKAAMQQETRLFSVHLIQEDRSVLDFLDSDYTFVNERLARHYGIEGIVGPEFRRVSVEGTARGGVLTQGSILTITSNPTRTSPVKRGKWILDNILGAPPPPAPPDVPELEEGKELTGTLRQRMEQHRENPLCASCHARMDPIGFGFENFDGIGGWREQDGAHPVDPAGQLTTGEAFHGPSELRRILLTSKRDEFLRCLSEKMLTYALGRGLEYYDRCAVEEIVRSMGAGECRFSSLVAAVVRSAPFQKRRGEGDRLEPGPEPAQTAAASQASRH